jgi:peptide/nickel transport system substrate-binding protein
MSQSGKRRAIAAALALGVATATVLVTGVQSAQAAPVKGGTLYVITHQDNLDHADPQRIYTGRDIAFMESYVFRTLVMYKPVPGTAGTALVPDLATDTGKATDNGKTWAFTLRPGTTYSDGSAIVCADVKYAISRTFATDVITGGPSYPIQYLDVATDAKGSPLYTGPYKKTGQAAFDKAVNCSSDNRTITFHLKYAKPDFNYAMSYPISSPVPAAKDTGDKMDLAPLSEGPYMVASYKVKSSMELVRNPKWSASNDSVRTNYPDKIIMKFGVSEDVRDQIFLKDTQKNAINYDAMQLQNNISFWGSAASKTRGLNVYDPYTSYAAYNVSKGHLDCLEVRKALFFAYPYDAIIKLNGGADLYGTPGDNAIKPNEGIDYAKTTSHINDANFKSAGNPAYSKQLLEQAKTKCPATYAKATSASKGITIDTGDTASAKKVAAIITPAMKAAGIVVKYNYIPSGSYYSTIQDNTKQGDISGAGWGPDWANASTVIPPLFLKDGGFDLSQNWNDPAYPAFKVLADKANATLDRAAQAKAWQVAAEYAMAQYWLGPVSFTKQQLSWGSGVGGVDFWAPQGTFLFPALYVKG